MYFECIDFIVSKYYGLQHFFSQVYSQLPVTDEITLQSAHENIHDYKSCTHVLDPQFYEVIFKLSPQLILPI